MKRVHVHVGVNVVCSTMPQKIIHVCTHAFVWVWVRFILLETVAAWFMVTAPLYSDLPARFSTSVCVCVCVCVCNIVQMYIAASIDLY